MVLRFRLFGFPVAVEALFFLMAYFIGPRHPTRQALLWIVAVFVGVLLHELGHAVAARAFGLQPDILLHGFGGRTSWRQGKQLGVFQSILLSAAGPGVGIFIGGLCMLLQARVPVQGLGGDLLNDLIWINLGWGLLNLLPVLPLDGGQIASTAATALFGRRGRLVALFLSLVLTVSLGVWALIHLRIWLGILAVILSISNIQALGLRQKKPKPVPVSDAESSYRMARSLVAAGDDDAALDWLETAIHAGFNEGLALDADPAWARLRRHPRFVLLRRLMAASTREG